MIAVFFTDATSPPTLAMKLSLVQGLGITTGAVLLSTVGKKIRHYKWSLTAFVGFMTVFGGLTALANPERRAMTMAFVFFEQVCYGWCQYLSIAYIQMGVDQVELGISGGLA